MQKLFDKIPHICREKFGIDSSSLFIKQAIIGKHLTAMRLTNDSVGLSLTLDEKRPFLKRSHRNFGAFTPNHISGQSLDALFKIPSDYNCMAGNLKLAAYNALSSGALNRSGYILLKDTDPMDIMQINAGDSVTLVGAFSSYIRKLKSGPYRLRVLELNEQVFRPEDKHLYVPAKQASEVLPDSDVVIITGSTLANGTFEGLTNYFNKKTKVLITGPSVGLLPEVLFDVGISIIGTLQISHPDSVMQTVAEGGTGYHLFRYGAEKITILSD
jgi:uncharacterized protein (DUF4213/DUF364 family)